MDWIRAEFEEPLAKVKQCLLDDIARARQLGPSGDQWQLGLDAIETIAAAGDRLVRPQLVLLGCAGGGGTLDDERVVAFSAGVELMHLFALVHDDVMDRGTIRRGAPAVHRVLGRAQAPGQRHRGDHLAILLGDLLHARAVRLMLRASSLPGGARALDTVLHAGCRAGVGQFVDLQGWDGPAPAMDDPAFRQVLLNKGGHHSITAPLVAGWQLAKGDVAAPLLESWGDHVGLAFQGLDDLQDILVTPAMLGKDTLQDLREGRVSLVGRLLRTLLEPDAWEDLRPDLGRGVMPPAARARLYSLFARLRLVERGVEVVRAELAAAQALRQGAVLPRALGDGLAEVETRLAAFADQLVTAPAPI